MTTPTEYLKTALEQFSSSDDSIREEAFSRLMARSRPFLHALLAQSLPSESDREDVVGEIVHRIWKSRERLEFASVGAWWRFLRTMAKNCTIDHLRTADPALNLDDPELQDLLPTECEQVDALVEAMEDRRALYRLADEVFLALPRNMPDRLRSRHLLAAKLLLLEKLDWHDVCQIVNSGANDDELIGRADLDRLLLDDTLIRHLAYSELHWENERLAMHLMAKWRDVTDHYENEASQLEDHLYAVQLRFQYALLLEQIANRMGSKLKKSELEAIFDRCVAHFPFIEIMNRLLTDVGPFTDARQQLRDSGLWNRLVFQYFCHNGLPHRDIYDRTAPASRVVGYEITPGKLNVGLSNGRLFKKMAEHLAQTGEV